jgi:glycosyltransferase involved in cell wall biosynthesis
MNIAYITAGAGGMYCGSCLRDNALAAQLLKSGHEVHLIPVYTPTRTDETNVSQKRVFLGGINVYLQQHLGLFRKTPWFLDRLWDDPAILNIATRWGVRIDPAHLGALTVSMLRGGDGFQHKEIQKLALFLKRELSPDVINLPNSLLMGLAPEFKAQMDTPICCTLQGEELFLQGLTQSHRDESLRLIRSHAAYVDAFIAVSEYCASYMTDFLGLPGKKIHVVPLGINLEGHGLKEKHSADPFTIGYLARIAPEKGLHELCEAYRRLRAKKKSPPSRLWAAGYLAPEYRSYLAGIERKISEWGLGQEFKFHGELDREEKIRFLHSLNILSVPSPYDEPKGIYLLEAMANGVPVVQPRRGAFPEIVETTGGGLLVDPDDPEALAEGILSLWENPEKRTELSQRASQGVRDHFSAEKMAQRALSVYQTLIDATRLSASSRLV